MSHPAAGGGLLQLLPRRPHPLPQLHQPQAQAPDLALVRLVVGGEGGQVLVEEAEGRRPLPLVVRLAPD